MDTSRIDWQALRREYKQATLSEADTPEEPFPLLLRWLEEAVQAQVPEPNAFVLATADATGQPHARVVLLKGVEPPYLYFYTHYESAKGQEIAQNPRVAATFWWESLERQLRVEGLAEKAPSEVSDAYFATRPYGSQIGAWASPQSRPISRAALEQQWAAYAAQYPEGQVPRPPYWGGYRIRIQRVEFWQGRPSRLHDRIVYWQEGGRWHKVRLAP